MRRWIALLLIATTLAGCATIRPQSRLILDEEYFRLVHSQIQNAKESIYLISYLFLVYDFENAYSNRILNGLIEAKERGLDVHVVHRY